MDTINGQTFLKMLQNAASLIYLEKDKLNRMNVFPVPDGDTGINMYKTLIATHNIKTTSTNIGEVSQLVADAMLSSSRGNSGTILATFFIGVAKAQEGKEAVNIKEMLSAFNAGQRSSYKMIMSPQEGTILTVMRETSSLKNHKFESFIDLFEHMIQEAKESTKRTPELLPVLKQAGVVDSGAYGFVIMLEGMLKALKGEIIEINEEENIAQANFLDFDEEDVKFAFCCEGVIDKYEEYRGVDKCDELKHAIFELGNSEVFVETNKLIKFHIHVNDHTKVVDLASKYGRLTFWKVDNMKEQLEEMKNRKAYALIPVVIGDGFEQLFLDGGATAVINGGSSLNVSFEEINSFIAKTNAKTTYLFPNNKDTIATCELIRQTVKSSNIVVIPTVNMAQGYFVLSKFNDEKTPEENELTFIKAMSKCAGLAITNAAKDSLINELDVKKGDSVLLLGHKIIANEKTEEDMFNRVGDMLLKYSSVSIFYGDMVSEEEANNFANILEEKYDGDVDVFTIYGGQSIYRYVILGE